MFLVKPKKDFANFKAGTTYEVLETGKDTDGSLMVMVADDNLDIVLIPCIKFKYVKGPAFPIKGAGTSSKPRRKRGPNKPKPSLPVDQS